MDDRGGAQLDHMVNAEGCFAIMSNEIVQFWMLFGVCEWIVKQNERGIEWQCEEVGKSEEQSNAYGKNHLIITFKKQTS